MRRITVLGLGVGAVAVGAVVMLVLSSLTGVVPTASASPSCLSTIGPWTGGSADQGRNDAAALDDVQRGIAGQIVSIGRERGVSPRGWQVAIQAGMTESGLRNLDHGDADSLGIFQMRPSMGWGTPAQLQDVPYEVNKFFDVLLKIEGWEEMRPGNAAQAVERSAFPDRYHRWEAMATFLIGELGGVSDPSGCSSGAPASGPAAEQAIAFALAEQGKPYLWGGNGPDAWDCSGLMLAAYRSAGITLPRVADQQYHAGKHVPIGEVAPGDLVFWSYDPNDPSGIHHVAMYIGDRKVVQAPYDGQPVQVSAIDDPRLVKASELVPLATRPGA